MKEDPDAFVGFDELTEFTEADYAAVASRPRSTDGKFKIRSHSCSTEPMRYGTFSNELPREALTAEQVMEALKRAKLPLQDPIRARPPFLGPVPLWLYQKVVTEKEP